MISFAERKFSDEELIVLKDLIEKNMDHINCPKWDNESWIKKKTTWRKLSLAFRKKTNRHKPWNLLRETYMEIKRASQRSSGKPLKPAASGSLNVTPVHSTEASKADNSTDPPEDTSETCEEEKLPKKVSITEFVPNCPNLDKIQEELRNFAIEDDSTESTDSDTCTDSDEQESETTCIPSKAEVVADCQSKEGGGSQPHLEKVPEELRDSAKEDDSLEDTDSDSDEQESVATCIPAKAKVAADCQNKEGGKKIPEELKNFPKEDDSTEASSSDLDGHLSEATCTPSLNDSEESLTFSPYIACPDQGLSYEDMFFIGESIRAQEKHELMLKHKMQKHSMQMKIMEQLYQAEIKKNKMLELDLEYKKYKKMH